MFEKWMERAFSRAAGGAVQAAAKLAPKRQMDFLVSRRGGAWRVDSWMMAPGWWFLQVGHWCLEVAWNTNAELRAAAGASPR